MEHAAAVGLSYLMAWLALVEAARVEPGEVVLLIGASDSVGRAAT
jgi:NADPH:quinone reductase